MIISLKLFSKPPSWVQTSPALPQMNTTLGITKIQVIQMLVRSTLHLCIVLTK